MPNAVIAHDPDGDLRRRGAQGARRRPALHGRARPRAAGDRARSASTGTRPPGSSARATAAGRSAQHHVVAHRLRRQAQHPAPARHGRLQGHGVPATATADGRAGARAGRRLPVERPGRPGGHRRIRRAGDPGAARRARCRPSASASATRCSASRVGGRTEEDAPGPPRREPSGEGHDHRQGRDRVDEPRLRGGSRRACRRPPWRPTSRCSTARTAASR